MGKRAIKSTTGAKWVELGRQRLGRFEIVIKKTIFATTRGCARAGRGLAFGRRSVS